MSNLIETNNPDWKQDSNETIEYKAKRRALLDRRQELSASISNREQKINNGTSVAFMTFVVCAFVFIFIAAVLLYG